MAVEAGQCLPLPFPWPSVPVSASLRLIHVLDEARQQFTELLLALNRQAMGVVLEYLEAGPRPRASTGIAALEPVTMSLGSLISTSDYFRDVTIGVLLA